MTFIRLLFCQTLSVVIITTPSVFFMIYVTGQAYNDFSQFSFSIPKDSSESSSRGDDICDRLSTCVAHGIKSEQYNI